MENLDIDVFALENDGQIASNITQANSQEAQEFHFQRCLRTLIHALECRDARCQHLNFPSCQGMKRVVIHAKICKRKTKGDCPICKQLIAMCCYHAEHCQETNCSVPFCSNIKQKQNQQQLQIRMSTLNIDDISQ